MSRGIAPRALLILLTVLLAFGTLGGVALAAGPRDKDKKDRDERGGGAEQTEVAPEVQGVADDADGDYFPDVIDNCPGTPNPDQADGDGNGMGDACQPVDLDGDGVRDVRDNCPDTPNGRQNDKDGDGTGDACDRRDDSVEARRDDGDAAAADEAAAEDDEARDETDEASDDEDAEDEDAGRDEPRAREGDVPTYRPPRPPEGPPPVLKPFVVPSSAVEVIARIDAGAVPPDADEPAGEEAAEAASVGEDFAATDEATYMAVDEDDFLEREEAMLAAEEAAAFDEGDADADILADDDAGAVAGWDRDDYFEGGLARRRESVKTIAGTENDELYLTQRRGDARGRPGEFAYAIPVPEDGTYRVRLHFAEIYWGASGGGTGGAGKRVFSVDAEGEPKLVDYDIYDDVGPETAVVKQFEVDVADGRLDLWFYGRRDQPMVAAIEVLAGPTGERWVDVDKSTRTVRLMIGDTAVAAFRASMSVGPEDDYHDTMPGTYYISSKVAELTWTPYARNYFMYWAGFDPARENGFHSWTMDYKGRVIPGGDGPTWGCVATKPEDAAKIYAFVEIGTRVEIHW